MKNKALYIGLGVVALGGIAYFMMRKKSADASASDEMETKSAEASTETTTPTKGSALTMGTPSAADCGCGTGQKPCPNQRCAQKTETSPVAAKPNAAPTIAASSALSDEAFALLGITRADYEKMETKKRLIQEAFPSAMLAGKRGKMLRGFAEANNISMEAYRKARKALRRARATGSIIETASLSSSPMGSISPQTDSETETFAFNLTF